MASMLFSVKPLDPMTFAAGSALLAVIALSACALPALRASRCDRSSILRED
jgi:hypothetical protein